MKKTKKILDHYTPGPWGVNVWTTGRRTVETDKGLVICEVHPVHTLEGQSSNAQLIASAPELAEALRGMFAAADEIAGEFIAHKKVARWDIVNHAYIAASRALAKAGVCNEH